MVTLSYLVPSLTHRLLIAPVISNIISSLAADIFTSPPRPGTSQQRQAARWKLEQLNSEACNLPLISNIFDSPE
ncbi:hypothetical protein RRG08_020853 [Elysia crispata]|uniref:Uncharacterized protein n=1 Tax=Elysia crispata TaxID=231223 RepID=A0AAE0XUV5_9GAST|nr:hypothetical protein RRG08_020853 [Elysia crispata]